MKIDYVKMVSKEIVVYAIKVIKEPEYGNDTEFTEEVEMKFSGKDIEWFDRTLRCYPTVLLEYNDVDYYLKKGNVFKSKNGKIFKYHISEEKDWLDSYESTMGTSNRIRLVDV